MSKKIKMVLVLVIMLSLAGSVQAEVHYFWGNASGDWAATSGVWNDHPACCTNPSPTSLDQDIAITIGNVTIDVTTAGQGAIDLMGGYHTGNSVINVHPGIYWQITNYGQIGCGNDADTDFASLVLNVYGSASFGQLCVGNSKYDTGIVNVYAGGSLVVGAWGCTVGFAGADATGTINLNQSGSMTINSGLTMNPKGHIDIESGTLKVLGDYVTQLQGYVNNGWITSFGGASPHCFPVVSFLDGYTYVKTTGCTCVTYLSADLNHDCYVDMLDFAIFAEHWLNCSNPQDPQCIILSALQQLTSDVNDPQGRTILKFQHSSNPNWGYASPQTDVFYIVVPNEAPSAGLPMRVILHSAGDSAKSALQAAFIAHYLHYQTDPGYYGIYLDCKGNSNVDWWWGWYSIKDDPDKETKYRNALCPTEKRMTDTILWAINHFQIDPNRVYLSGISMGGSGSLGFGIRRGDLFAAVSVAVPAGIDHAMWRNNNFISQPSIDPPYVVDFSSPIDSWSQGQEILIPAMQNAKFPLVFAFGPFGHSADITSANTAAVEFSWLSIRKDQSYPVFTNATTDQVFPGYNPANTTSGQINAYFRWENLTDNNSVYDIKLRLVTASELSKTITIPTSSTVDVTPRRLQEFHIAPNTEYHYKLTQGGNILQSGVASSNGDGLLTIPALIITANPSILEITE